MALGMSTDITALEPPPLDLPPPSAEALFEGPRSEQTFGGESGIRLGPAFATSEQARIREIIKAQLIENAKAISIAAAEDVAAVELEQYHEVADRHDHRRLLSKMGRILGSEGVSEIKAMSYFDFVRNGFGEFYLSDEEQVGHEQICFRIARPHQRQDVGTLHRDRWFWEHYDWPVPAGEHRAKSWVAVCGEPERMGLLLGVGSHQMRAPYRIETIDGKMGFAPDFDLGAVEMRRYAGDLGQPVLFNYGTLHVGSINRAETCRVSFEITIMFKGDA